jgi:cytochrome b561
MSDGASAWPLPLRLIHWASAALVLGALVLGAVMVELVQDPAARFELTQTHKSLGVAVLALTAARLCVRILTAAPQPMPLAPPLRTAARAAHLSLYALLVLLPLSGWLMATTTPVRVPTTVFGLFRLPYPLSPDLPAYRFAHALHAAAAVALAALIVLHVAAALIHSLWWRDRVLMRMWRLPAGERSSAG